VGNIFQLGTHYTTRMKGALFTDQDGTEKPYYMGCYGIGIGRTLATVVECCHDDHGIIWPKSIAPYQVHLVSLGKDEAISKECDKLYESLLSAGIEVLYDDRDRTAGFKLADADLIGIPIRLVVSGRTLEKKSVEWKEREKTEAEMVSLTEVGKKVKLYYS
jgi:prolyl-tRNA synthetase